MKKLFNKGSRSIIIKVDGKDLHIRPNIWTPVEDDAKADRLLRMYPRELTSSPDVVSHAEKENERLRAENARLLQEMQTLQTQISNFEKVVKTAISPDPVLPVSISPEFAPSETPAPVPAPPADVPAEDPAPPAAKPKPPTAKPKAKSGKTA